MKTFQNFTSEAYYRAHRGTDYKGRDYGGTPEDHERAMRTAERVKNIRGGWLERERAEKKNKSVNEQGDWWHPDTKKDAAISGAANKMRARENMGRDTSVQKEPDYSNRLKPGETYMQFAKRKGGSSSTKPAAKSSIKDRIKSKLGKAIDKVSGIK